MKNFKPGQKVTFKKVGCQNLNLRYPKENEIITIKCRCNVYPDHWGIVEYPISYSGALQSIGELNLFPLDDDAITLTMTRAELREMKPKEVLEKTINNHLMQEQ